MRLHIGAWSSDTAPKVPPNSRDPPNNGLLPLVLPRTSARVAATHLPAALPAVPVFAVGGMAPRLFISGIGTGVGKTLVSSIFVQALRADYWKPVQAGDLHQSDSHVVRALVSNPDSTFHPETYRLEHPMSPHASAQRMGIGIELADFVPPDTSRPLVIEGAGGLLVPLNCSGSTILDLVERLQASVVVVSQHYLGSINHTLLTAHALSTRGVPVQGVVWNGDPNPDTEEAILRATGWPVLGRIRPEAAFDRDTVDRYAALFRPNLGVQ